MSEMTFEQAAEHAIIDQHPGCYIISRGQPAPIGEWEGVLYVECFTIDLMGQGQAILVYEVVIHEGGTGHTMIICSSHSLYREGTTKSFRYDEIPKVVKNLKWDDDGKEEVSEELEAEGQRIQRSDPVPIGEVTPVGRSKGDCVLCNGEETACGCQLQYTDEPGTWAVIEVKGGAH